MRHIEAAQLLGDRVSEGAFFVAEQLAFEEADWNSCTIDPDEGAVLACDSDGGSPAR